MLLNKPRFAVWDITPWQMINGGKFVNNGNTYLTHVVHVDTQVQAFAEFDLTQPQAVMTKILPKDHVSSTFLAMTSDGAATLLTQIHPNGRNAAVHAGIGEKLFEFPLIPGHTQASGGLSVQGDLACVTRVWPGNTPYELVIAKRIAGEWGITQILPIPEGTTRSYQVAISDSAETICCPGNTQYSPTYICQLVDGQYVANMFDFGTTHTFNRVTFINNDTILLAAVAVDSYEQLVKRFVRFGTSWFDSETFTIPEEFLGTYNKGLARLTLEGDVLYVDEDNAYVRVFASTNYTTKARIETDPNTVYHTLPSGHRNETNTDWVVAQRGTEYDFCRLNFATESLEVFSTIR